MQGLRVADKELGTRFEFQFRDTVTPKLFRYVYLDQNKRAAVSLVFDRNTPVHYVLIETDSADFADALARRVAGAAPATSPEELKRQARNTFTSDTGSLVRLGLASGNKVEPDTLSIIREALADPSEAVRLSAIEAAALTQWPEYWESLVRISEQDTSERVREKARVAIGSLVPKPREE